MLHGAMVWAVAIPVLLYVLSGSVGTLLGTAGGLAGAGAQKAGTVADNPAARATTPAGLAGAYTLVTPEWVEDAANTASKAPGAHEDRFRLGLGASPLSGLRGACPRRGNAGCSDRPGC